MLLLLSVVLYNMLFLDRLFCAWPAHDVGSPSSWPSPLVELAFTHPMLPPCPLFPSPSL
jgi:hypothetical protein